MEISTRITTIGGVSPVMCFSSEGLFVWSLIDAPMSANRINRQNLWVSHGHLIELDGGRAALGIDPVTSRNRLGTVPTLRI